MKSSARRLTALLVAAGTVAALAACSPPATNLASCPIAYRPGDNSVLVDASGEPGSEPSVEFPTPLVAHDAQVSVIERGDGAVAYPSNTVELFITTYDPQTEAEVSSTGYDEPRRSLTEDDLFGQFAQCATAGSRLAVVADAASVFGSEEAAVNAGTDPTSVLVAVIDVHDTYLGKANGWDRLPEAGLPSVVLGPNGTPGIIMPNEDPPTDLRIATLKAGAGPTVEEGDDVVVQYTGILWGATEPFDSTWVGDGQSAAEPTVLTAKDFTDSPDDSGVIPGVAQALIGQQVGSQVIVVIPPEFGYPEGQSPQSIPAGSTLVFVIDILKIED